VIELAISLAGLAVCMGAGLAALPRTPLVAIAVSPIGAGFLCRLFIVFHDCGHHAYFRSRRANDAVGRALGVLLLTPYAFWRQAHAIHHGTHGDLGRRGVGDIETLTAAEYEALPRGKQLLYRLYRHPLVLFGLGGLYQFVLRHRLPCALPEPRGPMVRSILWNDFFLLLAFGAVAYLGGVGVLFWIWLLPILGMAGIAIWVFFVHHQFETTLWSPPSRWRFEEAALRGSSFYDLPWLLDWFTGHIGVHHVHHLCPRIPGYRLPAVLRDHPELARVNRIGLRESLSCAQLALWDEERGRLVSFREARVSSGSGTDRERDGDQGAAGKSGSPTRIWREKSEAVPAALARSVISLRRRRSANGSAVSILPRS
jgi:omega-6 fatty acid desaturase (delta-12 desaturase)